MTFHGVKIKDLTKISFYIIFISVIFLALYPRDFMTLSQDIPYEDKIKHLIAFAVLSYFLYKSGKKTKNIYKFLFLIIFACAIEIVQPFVGREASVKDIIASVSGIFLYFLYVLERM